MEVWLYVDAPMHEIQTHTYNIYDSKHRIECTVYKKRYRFTKQNTRDLYSKKSGLPEISGKPRLVYPRSRVNQPGLPEISGKPFLFMQIPFLKN